MSSLSPANQRDSVHRSPSGARTAGTSSRAKMPGSIEKVRSIKRPWPTRDAENDPADPGADVDGFENAIGRDVNFKLDRAIDDCKEFLRFSHSTLPKRPRAI